jgi:septal ring factor EnvC (AmiA/AmiB activator)
LDWWERTGSSSAAFTPRTGTGKIEADVEDEPMPTDDADLRAELSRLTAENERLKKQLADTRAQRAEYLDALCKLMPPVELPTEEEMAEQMKNLIPADQVLKEIREARKPRP